MNRALLALALCGCWTGSTATAMEPEPVPVRAPMPRSDAVQLTIQLQLVEGAPYELPDGTVVNVKGIGYLHLADSKNVSMATLVVVRDGQTADVSLANAHGSDVNQGVTQDALGWTFTLVMADPYHQPPSASVEARRQ
jgi:hypothetical protein